MESVRTLRSFPDPTFLQACDTDRIKIPILIPGASVNESQPSNPEECFRQYRNFRRESDPDRGDRVHIIRHAFESRCPVFCRCTGVVVVRYQECSRQTDNC